MKKSVIMFLLILVMVGCSNQKEINPIEKLIELGFEEIPGVDGKGIFYHKIDGNEEYVIGYSSDITAFIYNDDVLIMPSMAMVSSTECWYVEEDGFSEKCTEENKTDINHAYDYLEKLLKTLGVENLISLEDIFIEQINK